MFTNNKFCMYLMPVYKKTDFYRMPVQYIIGEWDFRDITLKLVPPIFIPRPETEILVDFVLKRLNYLQKEKQEILELGCGSGAISLAIAHSNKNVIPDRFHYLLILHTHICIHILLFILKLVFGDKFTFMRGVIMVLFR